VYLETFKELLETFKELLETFKELLETFKELLETFKELFETFKELFEPTPSKFLKLTALGWSLAFNTAQSGDCAEPQNQPARSIVIYSPSLLTRS
jgi:hypothetical protein